MMNSTLSLALNPIQLSPQIFRALHEFLVLVLLHFQLSLPLHADGVPRSRARISVPKLLPSSLSLAHVIQKWLVGLRGDFDALGLFKHGWCGILANGGGVGLVGFAAIGVGAFEDGEDSGV